MVVVAQVVEHSVVIREVGVRVSSITLLTLVPNALAPKSNA